MVISHGSPGVLVGSGRSDWVISGSYFGQYGSPDYRFLVKHVKSQGSRNDAAIIAARGRQECLRAQAMVDSLDTDTALLFRRCPV
jgi:hypothetical protein